MPGEVDWEELLDGERDEEGTAALPSDVEEGGLLLSEAAVVVVVVVIVRVAAVGDECVCPPSSESSCPFLV